MAFEISKSCAHFIEPHVRNYDENLQVTETERNNVVRDSQEDHRH